MPPTERAGWTMGELAAETREWAAANLTAPGLWLAVLVTLVFAVPGPADRVFWAVRLGREPNAPMGAVFSVVDVLIVATIVFGAWRWLLQGRSFAWSRHAAITVGLTLLNAMALISLFSTLGHIPADQTGAAFKGGVIFARMAALFAFVGMLIKRPADLRGLVVGLVLGAGALLANGALYSYQHRATLERLTAGTFGNDLYASVMAIVGLLLAGFAVMPWMTRIPRLAAGLGALGCIAGIAGTGTRTAAIFYIIGLAGLAYVFRSSRIPGWPNAVRWLIVLIGVFTVSQILAVIFLRASALFGLILSQLTHAQNVPELESRSVIWVGTLKMFQSHPWFGLGPGQWDFFRSQYGVVFVNFLDAHNTYLNILADDGVLVGILYLFVIGLAFWRGWRTFRRLNARDMQRAAAPADVALLGMIGIAITVWLLTDLDNSGALNLRAQTFYFCLLAIAYRSPEIFSVGRR